MSDTWISGGGVVLDTPLPVGTRIRLSPTGDPADDIEVFVHEGRVHVVGHYATVHAERIEPNVVTVHAVRPL